MAAWVGKVEMIKTIGEINPELLKEQDRYGWNTMTAGARFGQSEIIRAIGEIRGIGESLLEERDSKGLNAMTWAATTGKVEVIKAIGEISPELLKECDGSGLNAILLQGKEGRGDKSNR